MTLPNRPISYAEPQHSAREPRYSEVRTLQRHSVWNGERPWLSFSSPRLTSSTCGIHKMYNRRGFRGDSGCAILNREPVYAYRIDRGDLERRCLWSKSDIRSCFGQT